MKEIQADFSVDIVTNQKIDIKTYLEKVKIIKNKKNVYLSEAADLYYQEKYKKNIIEIFSDFYEIPKCPITKDFVCYQCVGVLKCGTYSKTCPKSKKNKHVAENNEKFKESVKISKEERRGSGNPMFGKIPWNKGLKASESDAIKEMIKKRTGIKHTEESKKKMSESAKKRKVHGHSGKKHSEESKQKMREKTIIRLKNGSFPKN
jgi:hypothetical protein